MNAFLLLITFSQFTETMTKLAFLIASLLMLLIVAESIVWLFRTVFLGLSAPILGHRAYFYTYRGDNFYSEKFLKILWFIRLGRNKKWALHHSRVGYVKKRFFGGNDLNNPVEIFTRSFGRKEPVAFARFLHDTDQNIKKADIILKEYFADGTSKYDVDRPVGYVDSEGGIFKYYQNYNAYQKDNKLEIAEKIGVCANFTLKGKNVFDTKGEESDLQVIPYIEGDDSSDHEGVIEDSWFSIRLNKPQSKNVRAIKLDTTNNRPIRRLRDLFLWWFIHAIPLGWPVKHKAFGYGFVKRNFKWFCNDNLDIPLSYIGCAALLLLEEQGFTRYEDQTVKDPDLGMGETALISLFGYLVSYKFLLLLPFITNVFPFLGPQISLILWMMLMFYLIWKGIHLIYNYVLWRPFAVKTILNMLNANVGTLTYSRLTIVFSIIGMAFTIFYLPHQLVPFFLSIIIAFFVNRRFAPQRKWEITDPFADGLFDDDGSDDDHSDDNYVENAVVREYNWSYSSFQGSTRNYLIQLKFNPYHIESLRNLNPFKGNPSKGYSATVKGMLEAEWNAEQSPAPEPFRPGLAEVLSKLKASIANRKFTRTEHLNFILSFVQGAITYVSDVESGTLNNIGIDKEYCRFSRETLFDQEGDCDCKSELAAALFAKMGLRVAYMTTADHAFIGISSSHFDELRQFMPEAFIKIKNEQFLCCETTASGWTIGKVGDSHRQELEDSEIIQFV